VEGIGKKAVTAMMNVFADPKETEGVEKKLVEMKEVLEVDTSRSESVVIVVEVMEKD